MRPNWFFAFPVSGNFISELPAPPASFRLFHPEDVHVTLSFLGGCGEDAAQRALLALNEALLRQPLPPIEVSLAQVVPMGPKPEYSALSALLQRGREQTEAAIAELRDVVSEVAIGRREKRPPKAHVTVARPGRRVTEAGREAGLVWASALDLSQIVARLDRVALYTWSEGNRRERLFRVVAEHRLPG
jgi:2'-5' RNA ligase